MVSKKAALGLSFGPGWKPTRMKSTLRLEDGGSAALMDDLGHLHGGSHSIMPCQAYSALPSILSIPPEPQGP